MTWWKGVTFNLERMHLFFLLMEIVLMKVCALLVPFYLCVVLRQPDYLNGLFPSEDSDKRESEK